jgi:hypothetical protein
MQDMWVLFNIAFEERGFKPYQSNEKIRKTIMDQYSPGVNLLGRNEIWGILDLLVDHLTGLFEEVKIREEFGMSMRKSRRIILVSYIAERNGYEIPETYSRGGERRELAENAWVKSELRDITDATTARQLTNGSIRQWSDKPFDSEEDEEEQDGKSKGTLGKNDDVPPPYGM